MDAGFVPVMLAPSDASGLTPMHPGALPATQPEGQRPVLLAVDLEPDAGHWQAYRVVAVEFAGLTADLMAGHLPALVAIPLWSRQADAIQMLHRLAELGYAGPVEVHAPDLPNRRMVMAELSQAARGLRIRLVTPRSPS